MSTYQKKSLFSRHETVEIVKSFLKDGAYIPKQDMPIFYGLLKDYPNSDFWKNYSLDFKLNSMAYFLTEDGKERLKIDFAVFSLDLKPEGKYNLESQKVGEDYCGKKQIQTISDLFK